MPGPDNNPADDGMVFGRSHTYERIETIFVKNKPGMPMEAVLRENMP